MFLRRNYFAVVFLLSLYYHQSGTRSEIQNGENEDELLLMTSVDVLKKSEISMSDHIIKILDHYKERDPVGVPGVPIPEPLEIPPLKHSFSVATMHFRDVRLYGLSKFRIDHIESDLTAMEVNAGFRIEVLHVNGSYTLLSWLSRSQGPFTIQLSNVYVEAKSRLQVESDGKLRAQEMNMDITFEHIAMNFENLGFAGSVFQSIINSVGTFLFDSIKPFILSEVNQNIRGDVNKQIATIPKTFPNSISPFDQMLAEARRIIRERNFDPYRLPDYNHTAGLFNVFMTHTWLTGLSSFYRMGNVTFAVRNGSVHATLDIGTQQLQGTSHWEVTIGAGMIARYGTIMFTVRYVRVQAYISQTMDTRNHPVLKDIQVDVGNIEMRCDGAGTLDYIIEFAINILPNLLRYQIVDALESPLKNYIQAEFNRISVETMIKERLSDIEAIRKQSSLFTKIT